MMGMRRVGVLIILGVVAVIAVVFVKIREPFLAVESVDATGYVTRMADTVKDTPECQQYRNQMMAYAPGNPASGKVQGPVGELKRLATNAGCAKE